MTAEYVFIAGTIYTLLTLLADMTLPHFWPHKNHAKARRVLGAACGVGLVVLLTSFVILTAQRAA